MCILSFFFEKSWLCSANISIVKTLEFYDVEQNMNRPVISDWTIIMSLTEEGIPRGSLLIELGFRNMMCLAYGTDIDHLASW